MAVRYRKIDGYVWCDKHGCIHVNSLDPYGYGDDDPDCCAHSNHRSVSGRFSDEEWTDQ